jgi:hypothetical protein
MWVKSDTVELALGGKYSIFFFFFFFFFLYMKYY